MGSNQRTAVVVGLETTGLSGTNDEILEFAAVRANAASKIEATFSVLVRGRQPVPSAIIKLTGITPKDMARQGCPPADAMKAYSVFVGARSVFFLSARFNMRLIKAAASNTG